MVSPWSKGGWVDSQLFDYTVGQATAVFQVRPAYGDELLRSYTVEPGKQFAGSWPVLAAGQVEHDYDVHGPNGFLRSFKGSIGADRKALLEVHSAYDEAAQHIALTRANRTSRAATVRVLDHYSGRALVFTLEPQQGTTRSWELHPQFGWYDFVVTVEGDSGFQVRLAGHNENGRPSVSEGGLRRKA